VYPKPRPETSLLSRAVCSLPALSPATPMRTRRNRRKPFLFTHLLHNSRTPRAWGNLLRASHPVFSLTSTISFRITFFAHPHRLNPIESYSCKKQRGGVARRPASSLADPIPFRFRIYEKTARNSFRIRTSKTQHLKSFRIRTYKKTGEGVGSLVATSIPRTAIQRDSLRFSIVRFSRDESWLSRFGFLFTGHRPRNTGHVSSRCLRALCVSALSFSRPWLSTFNCRLLALSPSKGQPFPSPRTSTLPPPIYGIIPPHRGITHMPHRLRGGFSD
jgi:hypothetical protein